MQATENLNPFCNTQVNQILSKIFACSRGNNSSEVVSRGILRSYTLLLSVEISRPVFIMGRKKQTKTKLTFPKHLPSVIL